MLKRTLKILAIIIGSLLLIFLLAGLVKPEVSYETEVSINKPIGEVFTKYNDISLIQNWIPQITNVKTIKESPTKIGTQYKMTLENNGQVIEMLETTTHYEENKLVGVHFNAGNMLKDNVFSFQSLGGNTKITGKHTCSGSNYLHKCMFAFFGSMFKNIDQSYADNFKKWIEE